MLVSRWLGCGILLLMGMCNSGSSVVLRGQQPSPTEMNPSVIDEILATIDSRFYNVARLTEEWRAQAPEVARRYAAAESEPAREAVVNEWLQQLQTSHTL